jgi:hypothetical protein
LRTPMLVALSLAVLVVADPAHAAPTPRAAPAPAVRTGTGGALDGELSFFGITTPYGAYASAGTGLGLGGRYQITLVPEGVLMNPRVHDDIGLEVGLDWSHYGWSTNDPFNGNVSWSFNEISPVVGGVWNFWLTDRLAVYPKLDLMYRIGWLSTSISGVNSPGGFGGFDAQFAAGLVYKLDRVALRAEIGSYTIRFGVGF